MSEFASSERRVQALYIAYFGRAADPKGHDYWVGRLEAGTILWPHMADAFAVQSEALSRYPQLAGFTAAEAAREEASQFVMNVYKDLFDRLPDQEGLAYWSGLLAGESASALPPAAFIRQVLAATPAGSTDDIALQHKISVAEYLTEALRRQKRAFEPQVLELAKRVVAATKLDPATVSDQKREIDRVLA